jgi:MoxR-like ATPase
MDRFLVRLTIGYPDFESQMEILRDRQVADPIDSVKQVADKNSVLKMRDEVRSVSVSDEILAYITRLSIASREHPMLTLGLSPRGALGVNRMAKAKAYMDGRDFVIPEDVQAIFSDVCAHRVIIGQAAKTQKLTAPDIMAELLSSVPLPHRKK